SAGTAPFPDYDCGIRAATGVQPGCGTGAPLGGWHRPRSGAIGPDHWQLPGRRRGCIHEFLILARASRDHNRGLRKDEDMKHTKLMAIVTMLLLGASGAAAQSLGDYARAVRKNKAETSSTTHHYDNDNLPTNETLSVVGPPPGADANAGQKAAAVDSSAAATTERQKTADEWNDKIANQKAKIDSLNHEIDLDQRELH